MAAFDFNAAIQKLVAEATARKKDILIGIRVEGVGGASIALGANERQRELLAFSDTLDDALQTALQRLNPPPPLTPKMANQQQKGGK